MTVASSWRWGRKGFKRVIKADFTVTIIKIKIQIYKIHLHSKFKQFLVTVFCTGLCFTYIMMHTFIIFYLFLSCPDYNVFVLATALILTVSLSICNNKIVRPAPDHSVLKR